MSGLVSLLALTLGCSEYKFDTNVDTNETAEEPEGPQPNIKVEPLDLGFGNWLTDCPTSPRTVTITNVGDDGTVLILDEVALEGAGQGSFAADLSAVDMELEKGESTTFTVTFEPDDYATFNANVMVRSNDFDEPEVPVSLEGTGADTATAEDTFHQPTPEAVDVVWVVDTSSSMTDKVAALQTGFENFISQFVTMGINYRMGVTSTDMTSTGLQGKFAGTTKIMDSETMTESEVIDTFLSNTSLGIEGSTDEMGLAGAKAALTEPNLSGTNANFLRTDAQLAIVVLSDENDFSSISASSFSTWLDGMKPDPEQSSFSAIVGGRSSGIFDLTVCQGLFADVQATGGDKYLDVIEATGGIWGDICDLDFRQVLTYLSFNAAGLHQTFDLSEDPSGITSIHVEVDGEEVPYDLRNGWSYVSDTNSVKFNGDSHPGSGATIVVTYPVRAECD